MQNCQRRRFARSADSKPVAESTTEVTTSSSLAPSTDHSDAPQLRNLSQSEIELGYDLGSQEYYDLQEDELGGENESMVERPPPANAPAFFFRWSPMRIIQMPQRRYYSSNNNNNRMQRAQREFILRASLGFIISLLLLFFNQILTRSKRRFGSGRQPAEQASFTGCILWFWQAALNLMWRSSSW